MNKRLVGKRISSEVEELYLRHLAEIWPTILRAYAALDLTAGDGQRTGHER
jgi:hypothetical protein